MTWIGADKVNWRECFDNGTELVVVIKRDYHMLVCGQIYMMDNRGGLGIENCVGTWDFQQSEVVKAMIVNTKEIE